MCDHSDPALQVDDSVTEMIEDAHKLRALGSDFVGAANALETLLSAGDLRASR